MTEHRDEVARRIGAKLQELIETAKSADLPMMEYLLTAALAEVDNILANEQRASRS
jgi:hypothetical protein